jgi:hypothetical protein
VKDIRAGEIDICAGEMYFRIHMVLFTSYCDT